MQAQFTFGGFRFEPATARLWDNSAEVRLTRKAALLLGALLERPVSKQELCANLWRGTVVSDDALVTSSPIYQRGFDFPKKMKQRDGCMASNAL